MSMDNDLVFTNRFVDCVKKPHAERSVEDLDYICHTLKKLTEFGIYDSTDLKSVPEQLVYEVHEKDTILYETGSKADCWYYVLAGSVMLSMNYFFSTGSSFGRCINSESREDQCHVLEKTKLLRINYTGEELKRFSQRAAKLANTRSQLTSNFENPTHNNIDSKTPGSPVSTLAASTKAEATVPLTGMAQGRSEKLRPSLENIMGVVIPKDQSVDHRKGEWSEMLELEFTDPHSRATSPGDSASITHCTSNVFPLSADVLSERDRRSKSEERFFSFHPDDIKMKKVSMSNNSLNKSMEDPISFEARIAAGSSQQKEGMTSSEVIVTRRQKSRERRYSAPPSDRRIHSVRDSVGSLDYLSESQVDSDDEESVQSESSSATSMDAVLEVLSKIPAYRSDEDIERVMDVLQYIPVFSNMTSNIRRALFQLLMLQTFENENSIVVDNGEEIDKWYVVLNGQLKLLRDSDIDRTYHVGDTFGINQSLKVLPHKGKLVTAEKSCTLCYVTSDDYCRVLTQGEENLKRKEVEGEVVAVLEKRAVDAKREGYFIVQATPDELLSNLCEETVDDLFMKDFLLTYSTFLPSATTISDKLKMTWQSGMPEKREKITVIMMYWVGEQFSDFESSDEMIEFLDWFEARLLEDGKVGEKRALDKLRSTRAAVRSIELDRAGTNHPLGFEVIGGWEIAHPIFVSKVEDDSLPEKNGLRVGDQILEINEMKCIKKELKEVMSTLRKNYKLSLIVKSNLPEFRTFVADPPKVPPDYSSKTPAPFPVIPHVPLMRCNSETKTSSINGKAFGKAPGSPKIKKKTPHIMKPLTAFSKLKRFKLGSRASSVTTMGSDNQESGITGPTPLKANTKMKPRKVSTENISMGEPKKSGPMKASSMEDIHSMSAQSSTAPKRGGNGGMMAKIVDSAVKLYLPDHTYKYLDISPSTTIAELINRGVQEFFPDKFVVSPPSEYCICMVTVDSRNGPIRNSVLPNHMTDLSNFIGLGSRYYLKERAFHGTLVQDDEAELIVKESRQWEYVLNLSPKQVAEELTRADSAVFCSIDSREYIADLWRNPDHLKKKNLAKFETIPNDEMYWVVTTIVSETRSEVRAKHIKQFIKVSRWCRELRNFNSMFHILSGLNHGLVQRLKSSWERVPSKHKKTMDDLIGYMNPFHNMAKYRELQRSTVPPLIPFFPIIKKDLTFLYDGNATQVKGLVNFEKLRMLAKQIRLVKTYCLQPMVPEPPQLDLGRLGGMLKSIHHSIRLRNKHSSATFASITDNAVKDVYSHHRMLKMVRKHLSRKYVILEEDLLERIAESSDRAVQLRRNPPSPLNRGKRKSAPNEKYYKTPIFAISPSPTTGSFSSDTSVSAVDGTISAPPLSPKKPVALSLSALASDSQQSTSIPPRSPTIQVSSADSNGVVQMVT